MKKRFTDEQIIGVLREAEVGATSIKALCRKHNITVTLLTRRCWSQCSSHVVLPEFNRWNPLSARMFMRHLEPSFCFNSISRNNDCASGCPS